MAWSGQGVSNELIVMLSKVGHSMTITVRGRLGMTLAIPMVCLVMVRLIRLLAIYASLGLGFSKFWLSQSSTGYLSNGI